MNQVTQILRGRPLPLDLVVHYGICNALSGALDTAKVRWFIGWLIGTSSILAHSDNHTQEHVQVLLQRPVVEYANQYYHVAYTYYSLKVYDQALVFFKALLSEQQTNVCGELHEHPRTLSLAHHLCVAGP